jgi:hypothetical protein
MRRRPVSCLAFMALILMLFSTACSTMSLKQYPSPSLRDLETASSQQGISAVAYRIKDEQESLDYFGVNLTSKGIFAVHLTVINNNPSISYLLPAESVRLGKAGTLGRADDPSSAASNAANAIGITGAALASPLLLAVATQQLSNSTVIKENFESKQLRTNTLDPGNKVSGFVYFRAENATQLGNIDVCFDAIDSINNKSLTYCTTLSLRR